MVEIKQTETDRNNRKGITINIRLGKRTKGGDTPEGGGMVWGFLT